MKQDAGNVPDSRRSWVMAAVGFVAMWFTFGTPLSYGILRAPLSEAFAIEPVTVSAVFSVMLFTFFIGSGAVGMFVGRLPIRAVVLSCALASALIAPSLYVVESYLGLLIVFGILGLSLGTVFVLLASVIPRWFETHRGVATGIIFVGNGLGIFLLPPVWQVSIATLGIERGFLIIMSVTALAFLLAGVICRRPDWADHSSATSGEIIEWVGRLAGTKTFQLLFVGIALGFGWYQLLAAYATDLFAYRGLTETSASALFGLIGGVSIISRIGGGYAADVTGVRRAFLASFASAALGVGLLFANSIPITVIGVFFVGIGLGGCATLYIPFLLQIYNPEKDTAIIGIFNIAGGVGALTMPLLGAVSITFTDGYTVALSLTLTIVVIAFLTVASVTRSSR